jgi:hypothetical protein
LAPAVLERRLSGRGGTVDATDLKSVGRKAVRVRVPPPAPADFDSCQLYPAPGRQYVGIGRGGQVMIGTARLGRIAVAITAAILAVIVPAGPFGRAEAEPAGTAQAAIRKHWDRQQTYVVDLGPLVVCTSPAAYPAALTSNTTRLTSASGGKAIFQDMFEAKYVPLREAGYVDIEEGATLATPPLLSRGVDTHGPGRLIRSRSEAVACEQARLMVVSATAKAKALAVDTFDDRQTRIDLPHFTSTRIRVLDDFRMAVGKTRFRIVKADLVPSWDEGYRRLSKGIANADFAAFMRIALALACLEDDGERKGCTWRLVDSEEANADKTFDYFASRAPARTRLEEVMQRRRRR